MHVQIFEASLYPRPPSIDGTSIDNILGGGGNRRWERRS